MASGSPPLTIQRFITIEDHLAAIDARLERLEVPGTMALFPWRIDELRPGWYHRNGDLYPLDSPEGLVLNGFSAAFKDDWGIVITGSDINVPTAYHSDGRPYFERAVNGVDRLPGSVQTDAIRNITAGTTGSHTSYGSFAGTSGTVSGAFSRTNKGSGASVGSGDMCFDLGFNASLVVPTATENRPLNRGMTPAIFLGVF